MNRRLAGVGATVAALIAVIVIAVVAGTGGDSGGGGDKKVVVVHGLIGSEKAPYFADPAVKAAFKKAGYDVQVDTAGSVQQLNADPKKYDFFFPGSSPVAAELAAKNGGKSFPTFYSPLVVYTFKDIADLLKASKIVTDDQGLPRFDIDMYEKFVSKPGNKWSDLPNNSVYKANKTLLATTTDPSKSNSALMFASLAAYVAGGKNRPVTAGEVGAVAPKITPLFVDQGYKQSSSEGPFEDYLALGKGKVPLLVGYESQLLALQIGHDPRLTGDMVTLYPSPGLVTRHTLVSSSAQGEAIGQLLLSDPTLLKEQATYGFRTPNANIFKQTLAAAKVTAPDLPADSVEASDWQTLEQLITAIGGQS